MEAIGGPYAQWLIYAIAGDCLIQAKGRYSAPYYIPEVAHEIPDIVLEGAVMADPDLANGIQLFRVTLKPFKAMAG